MSKAGASFDCPDCAEGDTGSWDGKLVLTVTILGRSAGITPVTRGGAKAGWDVSPGRRAGHSRRTRFRVGGDVGTGVGEIGVSAMISLSDGLSRDLRHICEQSKVGAVVEAERVPIQADVVCETASGGRSRLEHALHDGEDYELLFTSAIDHSSRAIRIGTMIAESGIWLQSADGSRQPLEAGGWEHSL